MTLSGFLMGVVVAGIGGMADEDANTRAKRFIARHEKEIRPLEIEVNRLWWDANLAGTDENYRKKEAAETRLEIALSDAKAFAEIKAIREARPSEPLLARQIEVLYLQYLPRQIDAELLKAMLAKSNAVEKSFNVFRPKVNGKELVDSEVRRVLRLSKDSKERQAVWQASKEVGPVVVADLAALIKLRNQAAAKLGFTNYQVMQLAIGEQSQEQLLKLFDALDELTRDSFQRAKKEIDEALARDYGVSVADLRPWHYHDPFFQEAPEFSGDRSDEVYKGVDIVKVSRQFYAGIGLPVDDVLARSDLYEKKGKNPHAFSTDIDREGDVRIITNLVPNRYWLSTMLHELGHAAYSKYIPRELPYVVRNDSHALTTEGVAMMFERFADNSDWLKALGVSVPNAKEFDEAAAKRRRNQLLIFSRWCQVMFRFEKALYENPEQDLSRLWWDLVEKYQELKRPEGRNAPDYAAKIHIVQAPVYYHNYLMGQLFASQVHRAIARQVLGGADPAKAVYVGNQAAGRFMKTRVFGPGRTLNWNELTRHATGAELSPQAFAADLAE